MAAATGSRIAPLTLLRLLALRGNEAEASAAIASTIDQATAEGQGLAVAWAHWAAAVLYNGLARYEEAASAALRATSDTLNPWMSMWALPELIEAAARIGDAGLARDALARLAETTQPCGNDVALGIEARCGALLSDGAAADGVYREAIDRLRRTRLRPELARGHLLYEEWLRRQGRRLDAREELRTAHEMLKGIGMEAFAGRAQRELLASGQQARKRSVETRDQLTAQEEQIARLARDGLWSRGPCARAACWPCAVRFPGSPLEAHRQSDARWTGHRFPPEARGATGSEGGVYAWLRVHACRCHRSRGL